MNRGLWGMALFALMCGAIAPRTALGDPDGVAYPLPPELAAVVVSDHARALRDSALAALEAGGADAGTGGDRAWARRLLLLLGDVGAKAAAERLAAGEVPRPLKAPLLQVVAASRHPGADRVLAVAAEEARPLLRMVAAQGLGAGRTGAAVPVLARLARDKRPGVRAAALRALFAIDTPQAAEARIALPLDPEPDLAAARFAWHRRAGDTDARLLALATDTFFNGGAPTARLAAAHLLGSPGLDTPIETLTHVIHENGSDSLGAWLMRWGLRVPQDGYDTVLMRRVAIAAALAILARRDATPAQRKNALDRAVGWVAAPVRMDPYRRDPIPEIELRRRLPDLGNAIIAPVLALLRSGRFYEPRHGVVLLRSLAEDDAVRELLALIDPVNDPFDPGLDPFTRTSIQRDAAEMLAGLDRIGREATARRILASDLDAQVKRDVLRALRTVDAAWGIPLLEAHCYTDAYVASGVGLDDDRTTLRYAALETLARRPEPEARRIRIADLFATGDRPQRRLALLLEAQDATSTAVLQRALLDRRELFQRVALSILAQPGAVDPETGRMLVFGYLGAVAGRRVAQASLIGPARLLEPYLARLTSYPHVDIVHKLLSAMVRQVPLEAVGFVRSHWASLPNQRRALTQIASVTGEPAVHAAIDLALERLSREPGDRLRASVSAVLAHRWGYRNAEIEAHWRYMLRHANDDFITLAVRSIAAPECADVTDLIVPLLDEARQTNALDEDASELDEVTLGQHVLTLMVAQPWPQIEEAVLEAALDRVAHTELRIRAARLLTGRVSDAGRSRLLEWLAGAQSAEGQGPEGAKADALLQRSVAAAIGVGGDDAVAATLYRKLVAELDQHYVVTARLDPDDPREGHVADRAGALARGVVLSRHGASIRGLVDVVFRPEYAVFASRAVRRQESLVNSGSVGRALDTASPLRVLRHEEANLYPVLPPDAGALVQQIAWAGDALLEEAFGQTLRRASRSGALAAFPDLYLLKVAQALRDGRDHTRRPRAAAAVEAHADRLAPVGAAGDYGVARHRVASSTRDRRFGQALAFQAQVVGIMRRRGYENEDRTLWRQEQARLAAISGQEHATRGLDELARDAFRRSVMHAPDLPEVLLIAATRRARVGFDLDLAERDARRAVTLERRALHEPRLSTLDGLALVLIIKGRGQEALDLLLPRLDGRESFRRARHFLRLAEAFVQVDEPQNAETAMTLALKHDPGLLEDALADPLLEPMRTSGGLERALRVARYRSREGL